MYWSDLKALPDVWVWSRDSPGCSGVVRWASRMSVSGRQDLPHGREALPVIWEWSGDLAGCPGEVWRLSWISGSGREALPYVRECSGVLPECS